MDLNQKLDITPIHSSILKDFHENKKETLKEVFDELNDSFQESILYVFVEDLSTNSLIDTFKFHFRDSQNLKNHEITSKLSYYTNDIYKGKYNLHYFLYPYKKTFIRKILKKICEFIKFTNFDCYDIYAPYKIHKIFKNVQDYHNYINPPNLLIKILNFIYISLIKTPIKFTTFIVGFYISYALFLMLLQGLKPDEINVSILSVSTQLFIILTILSIGFLFLPIFYFPIKMMGVKTKYFLTFIIFIILIISFGSMTINGIKILFSHTPLKEIFQTNPLIDIYLKVKKYPRFATLIIKDNNKESNLTVLVRFIDNKYIYYNTFCDFNLNKIKSQQSLTVLNFLTYKANEPLSAIATTKVEDIVNIKYAISRKYFCSICDCNKTKKAK